MYGHRKAVRGFAYGAGRRQTYKFAAPALRVLSWHFGLEDLILAAFDLGLRGLLAKVGNPVALDTKQLVYYTGPLGTPSRTTCTSSSA